METQPLNPPSSNSLSTSPPPPPPPPQQPPSPPPSSSEADKVNEPALKKTKMSSDDDTGVKPIRYQRRKVAIFIAYCGFGYKGMQKNPGAKTIEGDLEEALFFSGAVPAHERGQHKRYDWGRSARTDKGVSAVGQVISGRFYVDPPGFVNRLNSFLSPQIRVFGFKRATATFNAKKFCDRRRYVYLLPVFALDPGCHRDRESVMASIGSGEELVKCVECSERGRKVLGVVGNKRDNAEDEEEEGGNVASVQEVKSGAEEKLNEEREKGNNANGVGEEMSNNDDESIVKQRAEEECNACVVEDGNVAADDSKMNEEHEKANHVNGVGEEPKNDDESIVESQCGGEGEGVTPLKEEGADAGATEEGSKGEFKYGEDVKERLNRLLKYYEGTHNFHNFTTRTKADDPSAKRYIVSFRADTTLTIEGIEFVKCEVVGQSFMLHQIRKMMGMAVAVMRNFAPESIYETAFNRDVRINVPTAPEVGLYLDECFFTSYNNRWQGTHEELSMKNYEEEAEEFKIKNIYSHIAHTEHKEGSVALFLHSLNRRNYPDLCQTQEVVVDGASDALASAP